MNKPRIPGLLLTALLPGAAVAHPLGESSGGFLHLLFVHGAEPLLLLAAAWLMYRLLRGEHRTRHQSTHRSPPRKDQ